MLDQTKINVGIVMDDVTNHLVNPQRRHVVNKVTNRLTVRVCFLPKQKKAEIANKVMSAIGTNSFLC